MIDGYKLTQGILIAVIVLVIASGIYVFTFELDSSECYIEIAEKQCDLIDTELLYSSHQGISDTVGNLRLPFDFQCVKNREVVKEYKFVGEDKELCKRGFF